MAKKIQDVYEETETKLAIEQCLMLMYLTAKKAAQVTGLCAESQLSNQKSDTSEVLASMESFVCRFLFYVQESRIL